MATKLFRFPRLFPRPGISSTGIGGGLGIASAGPVIFDRFRLALCGLTALIEGLREFEATSGSFSLPFSSLAVGANGGSEGACIDSGEGGAL